MGLIAGYRRLWREEIRRHWKRLLLVLVLMAVVAVTAAGYAKFVQLLFEAFEGPDVTFLSWAPVMIVVLAILKGGSQFVQVVLASRIMVQIEAQLQNRLYRHLMFADLAHLQRENAAAYSARLWADTGVIGKSLGGILSGLSNVLVVITTFIMMLTIDWWLTLMIFAVFAFAIWPLIQIGNRVRTDSRRVQKQISTMTGEVNEGLSSMRLVRSYSLEPRLLEQAGTIIDRLRTSRVHLLTWKARVEPMMELLAGISSAVLLWLVVWQITEGTGSLADFMALLTGLGIAATPARRLGGVYTLAQQGLAAIERYFEIVDLENRVAERPDATRPEQVSGALDFENVGFAYPDGTTALSEISLRIPAGQKVAFVGRSGAGKSSLFNLLPRLFDPTSGRVTIDGVDLQDMTLDGLRAQIAVVSQDSVLLTGTVAENIAFGRPDASREEIEAAAVAAEAHGFISALREGYDTMIRPSETAFSGGEKQRLSIARAILRDAPILLLDEPTSALDARSEGAIREALERLAKGRTTLVIAHRLATILDSDMIVVMDQGRVVDTGTHAELVARDGIYAELYRLQFAGAQSDE